MPLTPSATKRAKQSITRHKRLMPYKTIMKTMMRKFSEAVKEGKKEEAKW
jgi:ribosomal protein S20